MLEHGLDALDSAYWTLGALGLAQALLLLVAMYENSRFFRMRLQRGLRWNYTPRVQLFMPCKGVEANFAETVKSVLQLNYPSYSVTFVVESTEDPAYQRLAQLLSQSADVSARVIVAGQAVGCGQKVHNLMTATATLDEGAEVLAFIDSDTAPERDWLRWLVARLCRKPGAVTGYRWFLAQRGDWPAIVLSALNGSVAFALGTHRWNHVWGGAWCIKRTTFEQLRAQGIWNGAVTEDLPVAPALRRLGLQVAYEPGCLVASPVQASWRNLIEFAARQYRITRIYSPRVWWVALVGTAVGQLALWGGMALTLVDLLAGRSAVAPACLVGLVWSIHALCGLLRQLTVARRFGHSANLSRESTSGLRAAAWLDVLGYPILGLCRLLLLLTSAFGRQINWRGIGYRMDGPHRTEILFRPLAEDCRRTQRRRMARSAAPAA